MGVTDTLNLVVEDGLCVQSTAWRFRPGGLIGSNFSSLSIGGKLAMRRKDQCKLNLLCPDVHLLPINYELASE